MSDLQSVFYPHAIQLPAITPNPAHDLTILNGLDTSRNYTLRKVKGASGTASCFIGASTSSPTIGYSTSQIRPVLQATALGVSPAGMSIVRDYSAGDIDLWYASGPPNGVRDLPATASHMRCRATQNAMVYWTGIQATPQEATIDVMIVMGAAVGDALQVVVNQAGLPDVSATGCGHVYKLGHVKINGLEVEAPESVNLALNPSRVSIIGGGDVSPNFNGIGEFDPMVSITSKNIEEFFFSTAGGQAVATFEMVLIRATETNFQDGNAATEHVVISGAVGTKLVESASGSPAENTIVLHIKEQDTAGVKKLFDVEVDSAYTP